jgi:hypothetical protein
MIFVTTTIAGNGRGDLFGNLDGVGARVTKKISEGGWGVTHEGILVQIEPDGHALTREDIGD